MNKVKRIVYEEIRALNDMPIDEWMYEIIVKTLWETTHEYNGKIITSGMGKAGQVAHNLALMLCSTGTPAVFLHPGEAQHGDLGVIQPNDVLLFVSNSGETEELIKTYTLANSLYGDRIIMILITGNKNSTLVGMSNAYLLTGDPQEVCPLGLTPTTSTTVMSVICDILVVILMEKIGFTAEEYYKRHHSGYLGQKAKKMIGGEE